MTNKQKEHHDLCILHHVLNLAHSLLHNHSTGISEKSFDMIHPMLDVVRDEVGNIVEDLDDSITAENLKEAI